MNQSSPLRVAFLFLLFAACALAADEKIDLDRRTPVPANEKMPIADFLRAEFLADPTINPGGTHVAAVVSAGEDKSRLIVYELATMKAEGYDPPAQSILFDVTWLTDSRLTFKMGLYKTYTSGLYATEVGRLSTPYPLLQSQSSRLLAVPRSQRTRPLASIPADYRDAGRDGHVYVLNTDNRTGKIVNMMMIGASEGDAEEIDVANRNHISERITGPTEGYGAGFLADREGKLAFAFTSENGVFAMHRRVGDGWEKAPVNLDEVDVLGFGRTHDEVIVRGPRIEGQPRTLQFLDVASGALGEVLINDQAYDFNGSLYYQPGPNNILGARFERNSPVMAWFHPDFLELQKLIDGYFPGLVVRLIGADERGGILLVETYSDRQPSCYYWINLEKKAFGPIEKSMPWIDPGRMRPTSIIKYKTADGQRLDAYVTLPAGASKEHPAPLIVLPPGITQPNRSNYRVDLTRASWHFDRQVQLWASRGYAVLQPNHRGSAGYGWMFPKEDAWAFGKMADDIAAATRALVGSGYVDPKRVGIQGFGLSAYLAVAAAESNPDLFQAVVAIQGTYDWARQFSNVKEASLAEVNYGVLARNLGNETNLKAISVNDKVSKIRGAVLVAYQREFGEETAQSTNLVSNLARAGIVHKSVPIGGARSTINLVQNQVEMFSRIEEFYAEHIRP